MSPSSSEKPNPSMIINRFVFRFNPNKVLNMRNRVRSTNSRALQVFLVSLPRQNAESKREAIERVQGRRGFKLVVKDLNSNVKIFSLLPPSLACTHTLSIYSLLPQLNTHTHTHTHTRTISLSHTRTLFSVHLYSWRCSSERVVGM